jgi:O-antigen/teichoic acid export membrane protein
MILINLNKIKGSKLLKNSFFNLLSIGFYALAQWWILSFLSHQQAFYEMGIYSYAISFVTPLVVFFNLNLRYLYLSDNNSHNQFSHYWTLRIASFFCAGLLIFFLTLFLKIDFFSKLLIYGVFGYKTIEALSDMLFAYQHKKQTLVNIAKSIFIRSVLIALFFTFTFIYFHNILLSLLSLVIVYFFTFYFLDKNFFLPISIRKELANLNIIESIKRPEFRNTVKKLFFQGLPIGTASLIYSLIVVVPRFFISSYLDIKILGIYSAIYYLFSSLLLVAIAFADASIPNFVRLFAEQQYKSFWKLLISYLIIVFICFFFASIVTYFYGDMFLEIAYGPTFGKYKFLFILGLIVTLIEVCSKFIFTALTSIRLFKFQPWIQLLTLILISFSCYFFRNSLSLTNIVIIQGAVYLIQFIVGISYLKIGLSAFNSGQNQ